MEDNKLIHEVKRHAVITLYTRNTATLKYRDFLMSPDRLFVHKVRRELKHLMAMWKVLPSAGNKPRSDTDRTPQFVQ